MKLSGPKVSRAINNRRRLAFFVVLAAVLLALIVFGAWYYPESALRPTSGQRNLPPSPAFPLGTDWLGRDLMARVAHGLWLSVRVSILTAGLSTLLSLVLALIATSHRAADRVISWLVDITIGLPQIVLAILISFAAGGGIRGVVLALTFTLWPPLTRLLRAEIYKVAAEPYVAASRARGKTGTWVAMHHILPSLVPHVIVGLTIAFPHAILHESTLTFLGFGIPPNTPSLGIILSEGMRYLTNDQWWAVLGPIVALVTVALVLERCGELSRSLLSPVTRNE